ncbi:MAG: hypothetical protein K9W46_07305 [Candidatus Heimdallarchaeum endolithica]|uniref:Uncharacterized protein n=1 Tax=Candidatus Heimdallarchaeum endolithica TaxID=2876572 RepID=A0A9Y1BNE6_9ARCH|nr:MAG: hypothetical protein K9W46_07305 [Candidatus Heimdallarchaeum endolithica]
MTKEKIREIQEHTELNHKRIVLLVDTIRNNLATIQLASLQCDKISETSISDSITPIIEFVDYIEKS